MKRGTGTGEEPAHLIKGIIAAHGAHAARVRNGANRAVDPITIPDELKTGILPLPREPEPGEDAIDAEDEQVGVIAAFDPTTGELTIDTIGGPSLTGVVVEETEIDADLTVGSIDDLIPGRGVSEAELALDSSGLVWEGIELARLNGDSIT
jgi:hypothetical protein